MEDKQKTTENIDRKLDDIRKETMAKPERKPPELTDAMIASVRGMGPWTRFLAVLGFISVGLMILAGATMMGISIFAGNARGGTMPAGMMIGMSLIYVIMAILYIFPSLYLWSTAGAVVRMKKGDIVGGMETALAKQKSFWKFIGIMVIVILGLYIIFFIVIVAVGAMGAIGSLATLH